MQTRGALQLSQYSNNVEILKDVGIVFLHIESRKNSTLTAVLVYLILLKSTTDFEKNSLKKNLKHYAEIKYL